MNQSIKIEEKKLDAIEGLLAQSQKGVHYLFEHHKIAEILRRPTEEIDFFTFENMDKVQDLFLELIERHSFSDKKNYLNSLDNESYEIVLRAYFHILENTVLSSQNFKH